MSLVVWVRLRGEERGAREPSRQERPDIGEARVTRRPLQTSLAKEEREWRSRDPGEVEKEVGFWSPETGYDLTHQM